MSIKMLGETRLLETKHTCTQNCQANAFLFLKKKKKVYREKFVQQGTRAGLILMVDAYLLWKVSKKKSSYRMGTENPTQEYD